MIYQTILGRLLVAYLAITTAHLSLVMSQQFAVVPKRTNSPFFDAVREGCEAKADKMGVTCLYTGPPVLANAKVRQLEIVEEILPQIDGLAIAVMNESATTEIINMAVESGVPVVTFDSDASDSKRFAYVGTDNEKFGRELAHVLLQLNPEGGKYGIISGNPSPNILKRVEGVRSGLMRSGWTEVSNSPTNCKGNATLGQEQMEHLVATNPDIGAIIPVGGWPSYEPIGWERFVTRHPQVTTVVADAIEVQIQLMNRGSIDGLVGQLPFQMGEFAIEKLYQFTQEGVTFNGQDAFATSVLNVLQIPQNLPSIQEDMNYIGNLRIMGYVLCGIILVFAIACFLWTALKRRHRVVRASQPGFLAMICFGTLVMGSAIIPLSIDDQNTSTRGCSIACMCLPWLIFTGFAITFSALFSKTWRIVKVFENAQRFRRVRVTAKDVLIPFLVLMTLNVIVLLCWTLIDPLQYERRPSSGTDNWNRVYRSYYGACYSENPVPYAVCLVVINFTVLVIAIVQAYRARNIETEYSESQYIAYIMVTMFQAWLVGIPILALIRDDPQATFVVLTVLIFVTCMATLGFLFIPKMIRARENDQERASTSGTSRTVVSGISRYQNSSAVINGTTVASSYQDRSSVIKPPENLGASTYQDASSSITKPPENPATSVPEPVILPTGESEACSGTASSTNPSGVPPTTE